MLICNCPNDLECPAIGSDVVCFPWCEYLDEGDGDAAEATENGRTMIKDSGERTKFPSGALRDIHTGKGRMDLLPWLAIMEVSKHCEAGALKYGEHNVDKGIPTHSLLDSAIRHAAKYLAGYVDEPHLVAAAWNLLWAIEMEIVHPECVDTPWRAADGE